MNAIDALLEAFMREHNVGIDEVEVVEKIMETDEGTEHSWYLRKSNGKREPSAGVAVFGVLKQLQDFGAMSQSDFERFMASVAGFMASNNIPIPTGDWEKALVGGER